MHWLTCCLASHLTFTASFDADGGDEQQAKQAERCYCPCSKISQQWLEVAGQKVSTAVDGMEFNCKGFYEPSGLLGHLGAKHDPLHCGVLAYIKEGLYSKYKKM